MTSSPSKLAGLEHRLDRRRAGEDDVGARGLDARDLRALGRRAASASCSTRSSSASRVIVKPCTPNVGRPAACCAATARLRTVPPMPTSRSALRDRTARRSSSSRDVLAQRLEVLLAGRAVVVEEALGHAHRAERPRAQVARLAVLDADELQRAAAEVEHRAVVERRRVHRGEVAVPRLLLLAEHADRAAPCARAASARNSLAVRRAADRARRDGVDVARARARRRG